jgi:hypothetical protein
VPIAQDVAWVSRDDPVELVRRRRAARPTLRLLAGSLDVGEPKAAPELTLTAAVRLRDASQTVIQVAQGRYVILARAGDGLRLLAAAGVRPDGRDGPYSRARVT